MASLWSDSVLKQIINACLEALLVKRSSVVVLLGLRTAAQEIPVEQRYNKNLACVLPTIQEPESGIIEALYDLERLGHIEVDYMDGVTDEFPAHSVKEVLRVYLVPENEVPWA